MSQLTLGAVGGALHKLQRGPGKPWLPAVGFLHTARRSLPALLVSVGAIVSVHRLLHICSHRICIRKIGSCGVCIRVSSHK